ncbi:MAG: DUF1700 domain-containing protein [Clostridia bacterium]|nr:DUF1700 domain-containing protein [Clostridia bacterium]
MSKQEFLLALRGALADLSEADIKASLDYYAEIIDDQMEEGIDEADAVASLGSVVTVAEQILMDLPLPKLVKARVKPKRRLRAWEMILIAVGSPVWFPILLALAVVVLAVYIVLWSVVVSLYAADLCLAAGFLAGITGSVALFVTASPAVALLFLGAGMACAGLAIFGFLGCNATAKGVFLLGKLIWRGIKACFVRKKGE